MDIRKFDSWLNRRQNHIGEGLLDGLFGKKPTPTYRLSEPAQIYSDPTVLKYTREVLSHLGLHTGLEIIDDSGKNIGTLSTPNPEFTQALMRFVAGHVLGNKTNFLHISHHDASFILNYLDHLRIPGERRTIGERLHLKNPNSLSQWLRSHVPTADDAIMQQGFGDASQSYVAPRRLNDTLKNEKVMSLARISYDLVKHLKDRAGKKSIQETMALCDKLSSAIGAIGIDVTDLMKPVPDAKPDLSPFRGRKRRS